MTAFPVLRSSVVVRSTGITISPTSIALSIPALYNLQLLRLNPHIPERISKEWASGAERCLAPFAQEDAAKLLAVIVLLVFSRQKESAAPHVWVLQCEDESAEDAAMRKLNEQLKKYVLKSSPVDAEGIEATIEVKLTGSKMKFLNVLQRLDGVRHATLVSYNGEYMS